MSDIPHEWACPICGYKWTPRLAQPDLIEAGYNNPGREYRFLATCSQKCAAEFEIREESLWTEANDEPA